jgi:hypothetical protein
MIDYKCLVQIYRDGHEIKTDTIITIEEDIIIEDKDVKFSKAERDIEFERQQIIESLLLEKLKEEFDEDVELINYEELIQQENLYKFEYKDVYDEDKARYDY